MDATLVVASIERNQIRKVETGDSNMKRFEDKINNIPIMENLHIKLIFVLIVTCTFGCLMVFSASSYMCSQKAMYNYDSMYMLKKQVIFVLAGFLIILGSLFFDVSKLVEKLAKLIYLAGYVCIFLLLSPLSVTSHGATRWINILGIQFQVAEIVKISVAVILAYMVQKYAKHLANPKLTIRMWIVGGAPAVLLFLISSDLSSSVVILAMVFGVTLITNDTLKLHLGVIIVAIVVVVSYVLYIANNLPNPDELSEVSFRVGRIAAWIDPERYASDQGYQTLNSLYAIGSGGLFGKGIGNSFMKQGPIPEAQNDMIFAIIVEELGIVGGCVLILLYVYIIYMLLRVIWKVNSLYESTLVLGIMIHIGVQAFFNIAVTMNVLPNTGIGLPFISYGGTAILCLMFEMALVCCIAKKNYVKNVKKEIKRYK